MKPNCELQYNIRDEFRNNSVEENQELTRILAHEDVILALNPACWYNIGTMIRSAFLFGFAKFIILGRSQYDKRTAVGTNHYVEIEKYNIMEGVNNEHFSAEKMLAYLALPHLKDYYFIFVEQCEWSTPLHHAVEKLKELDKNSNVPNESNRSKINKKMFIFGSESEGIPRLVLEHYRNHNRALFVEIPQRGIGRSHNISTAMGCILWEFYRDTF